MIKNMHNIINKFIIILKTFLILPNSLTSLLSTVNRWLICIINFYTFNKRSYIDSLSLLALLSILS